MPELKTVDLSKKYFECEGRKFYVKESLGFARYREMQKINLEFGYSASFHDLFKNIKSAWDYLNQTKLGEAAVVLHNVMYGVVSLEDKDDPAIRLCALFIDEEGEDPTIYDEARMKEKIDCWGRELDTLPFFQMASNIVPDWISAYSLVLNDGLMAAQKKQENPT